MKAQSNATGKLNPRSKSVIQKTKSGEFVREWESVNQIQRETGCLASSIFNCCNKRKSCHTAYGYVWEYKNGATDSNDNKKKT